MPGVRTWLAPALLNLIVERGQMGRVLPVWYDASSGGSSAVVQVGYWWGALHSSGWPAHPSTAPLDMLLWP
jgi:hypothetical protein